ncbi:MAG TPA: UvrB/UvrC motif-containing protein, partial [Verrucomicrobiae bacterium]|nr:UvrB/UvrC motif-containing protein [Verrucomicrobiae bacterium]
QMREAAKKFEFERAASLRDRIRALRQRDFAPLFDAATTAAAEPASVETPPADAKSAPAQNAKS